jgi:hypothetical protein
MSRDPLRPIPSPIARRYWERAAPPPAGATRPVDYDPVRLVAERSADSHGIDRRAQRRGAEPARGSNSHAALHRAVDGVLAVTTTGGWALVRALCVGPSGVLVRALDVTDRGLDARTRTAINAALVSLSPVLGSRPRGTQSSPLANVGVHLLAERVVADAAAWIGGTSGGAAASCAVRRHAVSLMVPPRHRSGRLQQLEGNLVPLNDPDPRVLGVGLSRTAVQNLELLLARPRVSRARTR